MKSLATWSCRSGSSASKVARDCVGEPDRELPDDSEEDEEDEDEEGTWLEPGDEGVNASAGRWRL